MAHLHQINFQTTDGSFEIGLFSFSSTLNPFGFRLRKPAGGFQLPFQVFLPYAILLPKSPAKACERLDYWHFLDYILPDLLFSALL